MIKAFLVDKTGKTLGEIDAQSHLDAGAIAVGSGTDQRVFVFQSTSRPSEGYKFVEVPVARYERIGDVYKPLAKTIWRPDANCDNRNDGLCINCSRPFNEHSTKFDPGDEHWCPGQGK